MEPKPRIYRYYAIRQGNSVLIRRSFNKIARIRSTVVVPKLPNSPTYLDDGYTLNKGIKISQTCYTGGELVGSLPMNVFTQKVITKYDSFANDSAIHLNLAQKRAVKALLDIK